MSGEFINEVALAEELGVSRTPIREAIRSMVDAGFLETRPRKGAIVRVLTAKELEQCSECNAIPGIILHVHCSRVEMKSNENIDELFLNTSYPCVTKFEFQIPRRRQDEVDPVNFPPNNQQMRLKVNSLWNSMYVCVFAGSAVVL